MKKLIFVTLFLILFANLATNAQNGDRDIDVRLGVGVSKFHAESDLLLLSEYELNAKLSDYFTLAPSILLHHSNHYDTDITNFFQANLNAFGSPFRNNRQTDFRMGGGLSFYRLNRGGAYATHSAFGLNLILENSYMVNERFFIGVKAFVQPYLNNNINYSILLKAGINL